MSFTLRCQDMVRGVRLTDVGSMERTRQDPFQRSVRSYFGSRLDSLLRVTSTPRWGDDVARRAQSGPIALPTLAPAKQEDAILPVPIFGRQVLGPIKTIDSSSSETDVDVAMPVCSPAKVAPPPTARLPTSSASAAASPSAPSAPMQTSPRLQKRRQDPTPSPRIALHRLRQSPRNSKWRPSWSSSRARVAYPSSTPEFHRAISRCSSECLLPRPDQFLDLSIRPPRASTGRRQRSSMLSPLLCLSCTKRMCRAIRFCAPDISMSSGQESARSPEQHARARWAGR